MSTPLTQRAETLAAMWRSEAQKRRTMSAHDASADVLDFCASEMLSELQSEDADAELTVAQYAEENNKASSTVRRWCKLGLISCREVGREYRIRRGEPCPKLAAA